jgi:hypothetical protein
MVDPARRVAPVERVDHTIGIDVEIKRVVGLAWVMRVTLERFLPINDLATVFQYALSSRNGTQRKYAFAVNPRGPYFNPSRWLRRGRCLCGHVAKTLVC